MGLFIEKSKKGLKKVENYPLHLSNQHPSTSLMKTIPTEDGEVLTSGLCTLEASNNGWLITGHGVRYEEIIIALTSYMKSIDLPDNLPEEKKPISIVKDNIFN